MTLLVDFYPDERQTIDKGTPKDGELIQEYGSRKEGKRGENRSHIYLWAVYTCGLGGRGAGEGEGDGRKSQPLLNVASHSRVP